MRKFATCFFALLLCAPSAFGATASRVIATGDADSDVARTTVAQVPAVRTTVSRRVLQNKKNQDTTNTEQKIITRGATRNAQNQNVSQSSKLEAAVNTVGRNARVSAASINNNPALRRAGVTLRPSTAEVGGRATIGGTDVQTGSNVDEAVRGVQSRAATRENAAEAKERLEQTAELNKSCQEQYNDCMDQFCAVVDANQGRCSCSSNLTKYTKVEKAVKDANAQLNEVAQRIRYVGLSADEIRAILTETEAEEALSGQKDTTETRDLLAEIESLIKDPTTSSSSYSESSFNWDYNLDFSSESADVFSLDFANTDNSSSFSNLRGADLYRAARNRCSTILNQCKSAGATSNQITGNYDLAIDKDCIAYEKGLKKMNETLVANVRSAELMLQKARLAVLQNKNQYDAKGCIAALDTCMRDDMVCGDNYFKCVDPTKRYIDENGEVVLGQDITLITDFMEYYNNAAINKQFLTDASAVQITDEQCKPSYNEKTKDDDTPEYEYLGGGDGTCVTKYLLEKIGTGDKVTDGGLCRAVLDKCQYYTYKDDKYQPYNDIVVNYIQRALVNIRAAQQNIISDYASSCMTDVAQCYNSQVTQVNAWSSSASIDNVYSVMRGACRNVALTCGYAIFADGATAGCAVKDDNPTTYIDCISKMFYESLLCPANSTFTDKSGLCSAQENANDTNCDGTVNLYATGYVNARCKCIDGYEAVAGYCKKACSALETRDTNDNCVCVANATKGENGICECKEGYTQIEGSKSCEPKAETNTTSEASE